MHSDLLDVETRRARALTAVLNFFLKHKRKPQTWRSTRTVLIHKKSDLNNLYTNY